MSNTDNNTSQNEQLFIAYFDGDLSPEEMDSFEQRLDTDEAFAREFGSYKKTVELVRSLPQVSAPPTLLPAIERRLQRRQQMRHNAYHLRFPYELVVFIALLVGIFYMYFVMVPDIPGPVAYTVKIQLSQPLTEQMKDEFGFTCADGQAGDFTLCKSRMSRGLAVKLVETLDPVTSQPVRLPPGVELFEFRIRAQNR